MSDLTPEELADRLEVLVQHLKYQGDPHYVPNVKAAIQMLRDYDEMLYGRKSMVHRRPALGEE